MRTVESNPDTTEWPQQALRETPRRLRDQGRLLRAALLPAHPGDGQMRPVRAPLGFVEPSLLEANRDLTLEGNGLFALRIEREKSGPSAARHANRIRVEPEGGSRAGLSRRRFSDCVDLPLRVVTEKGKREVQRLGPEDAQRLVSQLVALPGDDLLPNVFREV